MKKYIFAVMLLVGCMSNECVAQTNAHTFAVDNVKRLEGKLKPNMLAEEVANKWVEKESAGKLVAKSWGNESLYFTTPSVFFDCLVNAYTQHHSVILSPDIIWTLISQGFSYYVNLIPQAMRDKLVYHQGKMLLAVKSGEDLYSPNVKWEDILEGFDKQIAENTKGDIADVMRADFTTTGKTERIASQITLMSSVKAYFDYMVMYMSCGIPSITIEGTPDDWKKVLAKTERLRAYGLGWWVNDLTPILREFVSASEGKPNVEFWKSIVMKYCPDEMQDKSCSWDGTDTEVDGWFLKLMPFWKNGRTPEKVAFNTEMMLPNTASADFIYSVTDGAGNIIREIPMMMIAGLVGMDVDDEKNTMRPRVGWMVCEKDKETRMETLEKYITSSMRLDMRISFNGFPEILKDVEYLHYVDFRMPNGVEIPEWLDELKVDIIRFDGWFTPEYANRVKKMFKIHDKFQEGIENGRVFCMEFKSSKSFVPENFAYTRRMLNSGESAMISKYNDFDSYVKKKRLIEKDKKSNYINPDVVKHIDDRIIPVYFTVELDGTITDVKIFKNNNLTKECHDEVERLVREMPKWSPATKREKDGTSHLVRYRAMEYVLF